MSEMSPARICHVVARPPVFFDRPLSRADFGLALPQESDYLCFGMKS